MEHHVLDLLAGIDQVANARSDGEIDTLMRRLFARLDTDVGQFIFISLTMSPHGDGPSDYRYFGACNPSWLQLYVQRRWYMNDPFIAYALAETAPVEGRQIVLRSDGQRDFFERFRQYGFKSSLVTPARTARGNHVGILLVGSAVEPENGGEIALMTYRQIFRALAGELIEWRARGVGQEAAASFGLTVEEVRVLAMLSRGSSAPDIALALNITVNRVYKKIYPDLTQKMRVTHITEATNMAIALGLTQI
jgi:DNA-binding CsgD family transcriptional regulator